MSGEMQTTAELEIVQSKRKKSRNKDIDEFVETFGNWRYSDYF